MLTPDQKILVTGGEGFVGSHLVRRLVDGSNAQVYSLDNNFMVGSGRTKVKGVTYIEGSTIDIKNLVNFSPNLIFHLGEYSRVEQSFGDFNTVVESNVFGTMEVFKFCKANGIKVIYAASSTKFANVDEKTGEGKNQSPYAFSKATNTAWLNNLGRWYNLPYAITYFYNVYGEGEMTTGDYATVVGKFLEKSKRGEPLTVVSPGTQERNFTHVDDIVDGLVLVGQKGQGDNYCLGNPQKYTILELAKMIGGEIQMLPERPGNRMSAKLDLSRSTGELGWQPRISLRDYIDEFKKTLAPS